MNLTRVLEVLEQDLRTQLGETSVIILDDFASFKESIGAEGITNAQYRKAYDIAKKEASRLQDSIIRRDPVAYKAYENRLQDNTYMVGSISYANRVIKARVREYLSQVSTLGRSKKFTKEAEKSDFGDLKNDFMSEAKLKPGSLNQLEKVSSSLTSVVHGDKFSANARFVLSMYNDNPKVADIFEKQLNNLGDDLAPGDDIFESLYDTLRSKPAKLRKKSKKQTVRQGQGKPSISGKRKLGRVRSKSGRNVSVLALLNKINRELPRTIRSNMGTPRLNWRTGRFAHSVRATSIAPNNVIRYSYMRRPYAVFEMSSLGNAKWATPERDPRGLIDLSIRQIAASVTDQKFRTRRN